MVRVYTLAAKFGPDRRRCGCPQNSKVGQICSNLPRKGEIIQIKVKFRVLGYSTPPLSSAKFGSDRWKGSVYGKYSKTGQVRGFGLPPMAWYDAPFWWNLAWKTTSQIHGQGQGSHVHCKSGSISETVLELWLQPILTGNDVWPIERRRFRWISVTFNSFAYCNLTNVIFCTVVQQLTRFQLT